MDHTPAQTRAAIREAGDQLHHDYAVARGMLAWGLALVEEMAQTLESK
ncbi:MAG TPA: hypothetical protein VMM15_20030 [Bradyrhizobium sp.]|nr:hypothetical protein [Bradyrhizobium sp.]